MMLKLSPGRVPSRGAVGGGADGGAGRGGQAGRRVHHHSAARGGRALLRHVRDDLRVW